MGDGHVQESRTVQVEEEIGADAIMFNAALLEGIQPLPSEEEVKKSTTRSWRLVTDRRLSCGQQRKWSKSS